MLRLSTTTVDKEVSYNTTIRFIVIIIVITYLTALRKHII